jgi:hypothetical protein
MLPIIVLQPVVDDVDVASGSEAMIGHRDAIRHRSLASW